MKITVKYGCPELNFQRPDSCFGFRPNQKFNLQYLLKSCVSLPFLSLNKHTAKIVNVKKSRRKREKRSQRLACSQNSQANYSPQMAKNEGNSAVQF